jgi:hypothetical protein
MADLSWTIDRGPAALPQPVDTTISPSLTLEDRGLGC